MSNARATRPRLHHLAERVGAATSVDGPAEAVRGWIRGIVPRGPVKDALSGTPLGHALHPFLTDLPIGTWTSASLLDVVGVPGARPPAARLIATGLRRRRGAARGGPPDRGGPARRGPDRRERPERLGRHDAGRRRSAPHGRRA